MSKKLCLCVGIVAMPLLLALAGCGGSNPSTPTPVATPTPRPTPVITTLRIGTFTGLEPDFLLALPFGVSVIGDLEATVDWTFAENDLDLILTRGNHACRTPDGFIDFRTCTVVTSATSLTNKPERLRLSGTPIGDYTLYVGNVGPGRESLSYQVLLTFTPSAGAAPNTGLSAFGAPAPALERAARPWREDLE